MNVKKNPDTNFQRPQSPVLNEISSTLPLQLQDAISRYGVLVLLVLLSIAGKAQNASAQIVTPLETPFGHLEQDPVERALSKLGNDFGIYVNVPDSLSLPAEYTANILEALHTAISWNSTLQEPENLQVLQSLNFHILLGGQTIHSFGDQPNAFLQYTSPERTNFYLDILLHQIQQFGLKEFSRMAFLSNKLQAEYGFSKFSNWAGFPQVDRDPVLSLEEYEQGMSILEEALGQLNGQQRSLLQRLCFVISPQAFDEDLQQNISRITVPVHPRDTSAALKDKISEALLIYEQALSLFQNPREVSFFFRDEALLQNMSAVLDHLEGLPFFESREESERIDYAAMVARNLYRSEIEPTEVNVRAELESILGLQEKLRDMPIAQGRLALFITGNETMTTPSGEKVSLFAHPRVVDGLKTEEGAIDVIILRPEETASSVQKVRDALPQTILELPDGSLFLFEMHGSTTILAFDRSEFEFIAASKLAEHFKQRYLENPAQERDIINFGACVSHNFGAHFLNLLVIALKEAEVDVRSLQLPIVLGPSEHWQTIFASQLVHYYETYLNIGTDGKPNVLGHVFSEGTGFTSNPTFWMYDPDSDLVKQIR